MSADPSTTSPDPSTTSPTPPRPRRLFREDPIALAIGVSGRTVRNYLAKGYFKAYRVSGQTGIWYDLDEVRSAMRHIPGRKAKAGVGAYGPLAVIIDLPAQAVSVPVVHPDQDQTETSTS